MLEIKDDYYGIGIGTTLLEEIADES